VSSSAAAPYGRWRKRQRRTGWLEPVPGSTRSVYLHLEALEAGYLVECALDLLAFGAFVAAIVECSKSRVVFCKFLSQIEEVFGLPSKPVAVLCQHRVYTAGSQQVPYVVHVRMLQVYLALHRVVCLFENLIAFSGGVRSQGFDLLGE
jgi:hypothetical protein